MSNTSTKAALYSIGFPKQGRLDKANIVSSATELERHTKPKGIRGGKDGALGRTALDVLRIMLESTNPDSGRCYLTEETIRYRACCSQRTLTKALGRLEAVGIVSRERTSAGVK